MENIIKQIKLSIQKKPRDITIIYYYPIHQYILNNENWLIYDRRIEKTLFHIWRNK